jgi:hypothetical protein
MSLALLEGNGGALSLMLDTEDRKLPNQDKIGEGRLWSLSGVMLCQGRYRVFRDGSGWFACDPGPLRAGEAVELELQDGERVRVLVSRLAARNCLFRPASEGVEATT